MKVYGKNVVREALKDAKKIKRVYLTKDFKDKEIIDLIRNNKVSYEVVDKKVLESKNEKAQGIMAIIDDYEYFNYKDMINDNIIIILDHLEDPHNFGAIIRTVEAAGIKSIIIPKDRSVEISESVMRSSSGALNHVRVARVNNLVNTMKYFKDNGYFVYGAEADGKPYKSVDYSTKVVLVIGSEGNGLSHLVRKECDEIVSLPMNGKVNSLNASVAAGILIYDLISR